MSPTLMPKTLPTSDEDLLQAIANRSEEAFKKLYDRYSTLLYSVCVRILRNKTEAQGVLSEVFGEVWQNAKRFNPNRGKARTYLVLLTRSRAIDRVRMTTGRAQRDESFRLDKGPRLRDDELRDDPASIASAKENCTAVVEALRHLSDAQQEALRLAFFDGMSHREIAQHLDAPLGTVKTNIRQGLIKLRQAIKSYDLGIE